MEIETTEKALVKTEAPEKQSVVKARKSIQALLEGPQLKSAIAAALPRALKPERFIRVALNATMRTPKLLQCTQESFFRALLDLSALGIEPDGRRAHLIPFENKKAGTMEVQLIIDYKGLVEIVRRSGEVASIHADVVYENDTFEFCYGSDGMLKHKPNLEDRGKKMVCAYSFVKLKDGSEDFIVITKSAIEAVRRRSKSANSGPWVTDYDEMAKKSAFRNHSKWLPFSSEVRDVIEKDDEMAGIDVGGALDAATAQTIDLKQFSASSDENRGHDAVSPETTKASLPARRVVKEFDEFPDPMDFEAGTQIYVQGTLYGMNEDRTMWAKAEAK